MLEVRSTGELRSNGKTLSGYAAIFNSETDLGSFVEVIRNGAFRKSLEGGANIRALYHHQGDALLGTTRGGTLKLREDAKGLAFDLALPDTTVRGYLVHWLADWVREFGVDGFRADTVKHVLA